MEATFVLQPNTTSSNVIYNINNDNKKGKTYVDGYVVLSSIKSEIRKTIELQFRTTGCHDYAYISMYKNENVLNGYGCDNDRVFTRRNDALENAINNAGWMLSESITGKREEVFIKKALYALAEQLCPAAHEHAILSIYP